MSISISLPPTSVTSAIDVLYDGTILDVRRRLADVAAGGERRRPRLCSGDDMPIEAKILLVSDTASDRDELVVALEKRGHHVRAASTFEVSFAAAQEQPDLVVMDAGRLRDAELAKILGDDAVECPVVLFGSGSVIELRQLAAGCGAAGSFVRPGAAEAFADAVAPFLPRPSAAAPLGTSDDYVALARRSTRNQFVTSCPFPFLLSGASLVASQGPATESVLDPRLYEAVREILREAPRRPSDAARADLLARPTLIAKALRPAASSRGDKLSVGREPGVDILIDHATVSKLHAHFLPVRGGFQLEDAGSRNGTWAAGRLLAPRGDPSPVLESGDSVRFGELELTYSTSSATWDRLRVNMR